MAERRSPERVVAQTTNNPNHCSGSARCRSELGRRRVDAVGAVKRAVRLREPRAQERLGYCGGAVASKRRRGRQRCELADRDPRGGFAFELVLRLEQRTLSPGHRRRFARHSSENVGGLLVALERAQHVEAHDIAGAFPDRIDRRLAIEPRQHAFLDITVAAEAFHRFVNEARRRLADPIFCRRRDQPRIGRLARIRRRRGRKRAQAA